MESTDCAICGSSQYEFLIQTRDWLLNRQDSVTTFVKCRNCGLVYQNPRPSAAEIDVYYPSEYESYQENISGKADSRFLQYIKQYGIRKRSRVVTRQKSRGKLLDIGCSTGIFLEQFSNNPDWTVKGVEVSEYAAGIARGKKGLDVFWGTLEQANFEDNSFDVVTMWDVLEHLHKPKDSLEEINRILKPDGLLVLRVPSNDSLDARLFGPYWAGLDSPRHLFVFDNKSIRNILEKGGFKVENITCEIGSYPAFVLSLRFWMVGHRFNRSIQNWIEKFLYHPIARIGTSPLFKLISLVKRGPQIIVTAIKWREGQNA